jgi:hypothetical protein
VKGDGNTLFQLDSGTSFEAQDVLYILMALGITIIILQYTWILTLLCQPEVHTNLRGVLQCICSVH